MAGEEAPASSRRQRPGDSPARPDNDEEPVQHGAVSNEAVSDEEQDSDEEVTDASDDSLPPLCDPATGLSLAEGFMKAGQYDKAINLYSDLLRESSLAGPAEKSCPAARERHRMLLLARSAAYTALGEQLRSIPAAQSERRAINAPDPCHLAELGAQDAQAALSLAGCCPEALLRKAHALLLLEQFDAAAEALNAGLQAQACSQDLRQRLERLHAALPAGTGGCRESPCRRVLALPADATDDTDCSICSRLLYEPVTTPCGHSFCKGCLSRALDHSSRCPICRAVLHICTDLPVTRTLKALLERGFPEEYAARRREEEAADAAAGAAATGEAAAPLPLFVMSLMMPGQTTALNIFEPRYRLLVRRVMAGGRRFGMTEVNHRHQLCEVGCEVEITECRPLPDGRFYVEVLGTRRFAIQNTWELDGYRMAQPQFIADEAPEPGSEAATQLQEAAAEVERLAECWLCRLRGLAQTHRGLADIVRRGAAKPAPGDAEALSWWAANLVCPLLDSSGDPGLVTQLMLTRSSLERLNMEKQLLQQLSTVQPTQCSIM